MANFEVKKWDMTIVIDGKKYDTTSYLVIVPNGLATTYGNMDAFIHCHNENGTETHFNTETEAQEWIDHYGDAVDIRIEHGDEIHAYPLA